jgi:hypothetical protein
VEVSEKNVKKSRKLKQYNRLLTPSYKVFTFNKNASQHYNKIEKNKNTEKIMNSNDFKTHLGPCLRRFLLEIKVNRNFSSTSSWFPGDFFIFNVMSSLDTHILVTGVIHLSSIPGVSIRSDRTFKFQKNLSSQVFHDGEESWLILTVGCVSNLLKVCIITPSE